EDNDLIGQHFNIASGQFGIVLPLDALTHLAANGEHPLVAKFLAGGEQHRMIGFDDHLREAVAIAQIEKNLIVVRAIRVDPAVERDGLADVRFAQLAASMSALPGGHEDSHAVSPRASSSVNMSFLGGRARSPKLAAKRKMP